MTGPPPDRYYCHSIIFLILVAAVGPHMHTSKHKQAYTQAGPTYTQAKTHARAHANRHALSSHSVPAPMHYYYYLYHYYLYYYDLYDLYYYYYVRKIRMRIRTVTDPSWALSAS